MILYQIRNVLDGKRYVGQTLVSTKQRWAQHKSDLKYNRHKSGHLQNAWNKYGESAFVFEVITYATTKKELNMLEAETIKANNLLNDQFGYNIKAGGDNKLQSSQTKLKLSKTKRPNGWPDVISPTGKLYKIFALKTFCDEHDLTYSVMYKMLHKKCRHHKGWHLKETDLTLSTNDYRAQKIKHKQYPSIKDPNGIVYNGIINLKGFCKKMGLHSWHIRDVMYGRIRQYKGWTKAD